jgi:hypothetical protein
VQLIARRSRAAEFFQAVFLLRDAIEDAIGVDEAAREGGFVQGFECCRLLLLGELPLDVDVLPSGARSARTPAASTMSP